MYGDVMSSGEQYDPKLNLHYVHAKFPIPYAIITFHKKIVTQVFARIVNPKSSCFFLLWMCNCFKTSEFRTRLFNS